MGLDLYYNLKLKGVKESLFLNNEYEDIEKKEDYVDVYYRLNWNGVRLESTHLLIRFIEKYLQKFDIKDIDNDKKYMIIYKDLCIQEIKTGSDIINIKKDYDLLILEINLVQKFLNEQNKNLPVNLLSILAFFEWRGSNGEYIELYYRKERGIRLKTEIKKGKRKKILYKKEVMFLKKDNIEKEFDIDSYVKIFQPKIDLAKELLKNDFTYIGIKSKEIIEVLNYFFKNYKNKKIKFSTYWG
jgi:hypothetical protein